MQDPQVENRSRIIPKWLEYSDAVKRGELISYRKRTFETNEETKESIKTDLKDFKLNQTPEMACRLMGAGIIMGDNQLSHDMASFIATKGGLDPIALRLADKIIHVDEQAEPVTESYVIIANLRRRLSQFPNSAISWIDLSRAFAIAGHDEKAKKAAMAALQLAPYDRYIVRCAVRCFLHIGDFDRAWNYIKGASQYNLDPWIKATEVNVALITEHNIPDFKIPANLSSDQIFHYSELLESAGLLDIISGNDKKAKKKFRIAWSKPSQNVITHAEWILRNRLPGLRESTTLKFEQSLEAKTWVNYINFKLNEALDSAIQWGVEEPYSKYPFLIGSTIAVNAGYPEFGAKIAMKGLQIAPNDRFIFNGICYASLRAGKVDDASLYIDKLKFNDGTDLDLFCQATRGLYEFKIKKIDVGRQMYNEVMEQFRQKRAPHLEAEAFLNLALAELEAKTPSARYRAINSLNMTEIWEHPNMMWKYQTISILRKAVQKQLNAFVANI